MIEVFRSHAKIFPEPQFIISQMSKYSKAFSFFVDGVNPIPSMVSLCSCLFLSNKSFFSSNSPLRSAMIS